MKNAETEEEMSFVETFVRVAALAIGLIVIWRESGFMVVTLHLFAH
jgi:hypothetical protein